MLSIGTIAAKVFGTSNDRKLKSYRPNVEAINALEPELERLSDAELRARTDDVPQAAGRRRRAGRPAGAGLRHRARGGQAHARPAAFRRAADRRHGAAPGQDLRDEDRRGQDAGRHAARLPQRARRQAASTSSPSTTTSPSATPSGWAASTSSSGSPSACIVHELDDDQRREQYACDVTYATNNELGFDYLRDNMKMRAPEMVQRGHAYAIVDEVELDPDRRGAHAAHHLRPRRGPRRPLHRRRRADEGPGGRARQDREGARRRRTARSS